MTRVMAQGAFDLIHPGIIHYLQESADLGDELVVLVARDENRQGLIQDEDSRLALVSALKMVDEAVLGGTKEEGMFKRINEIEPDILTIGPCQPWTVEEVEDLLAGRGLDHITVVEVSPYDGPDSDSEALKQKLVEKQHPEPSR